MTDRGSFDLGQIVVRAADAAALNRWPSAIDRAAPHTRLPLDERVDTIITSFVRELTVVGAAAGATAATPGVGTIAGWSATGAEFAVTTTRSADMILTLGAAHGLAGATLEQRRAWILSVLMFGETASKGFTRLAGEVGLGLGRRATTSIPTASLQAINRRMGRTIITKYGGKRGAVAIGRVLPFGIGAVIGGSANYALTKAMGRHAHTFFSDIPPDLLSPPER